jgi:D-aminoacyl-tRNA deacylase
MNIAIICSTKDAAALNIKDSLLNLGFAQNNQKFEDHIVYEYKTAKLYTTDADSIYCENIDKRIHADLFIFATRHASKSGIHSLSVHTQGNWGTAHMEALITI